MIKFVALFIFIFSSNAFSSSCCGGGSSTSLIIVGDKKSEMTLGYVRKKDFGQTDIHGKSHYLKHSSKDNSHILNFQYAYQWSEYTQLATKFSVVSKDIKKSNFDEKSTGLGDLEFQYTFEYLPELSYSAFKPRGFLYAKLIIPTTKNMFNSKKILKSDVRGFGYYGMSVGQFYVKKINQINLRLATEWIHYFNTSTVSLKQSSFEKFIIPLGGSFDFLSLPISLGYTQSFNYQTSKKITGALHSTTGKEHYWEANFYLNYSPTDEDLYSLSYSDSSLIGKSINSPLYRSLSLNYTRSWSL